MGFKPWCKLGVFVLAGVAFVGCTSSAQRDKNLIAEKKGAPAFDTARQNQFPQVQPIGARQQPAPVDPFNTQPRPNLTPSGLNPAPGTGIPTAPPGLPLMNPINPGPGGSNQSFAPQNNAFGNPPPIVAPTNTFATQPGNTTTNTIMPVGAIPNSGPIAPRPDGFPQR